MIKNSSIHPSIPIDPIIIKELLKLYQDAMVLAMKITIREPIYDFVEAQDPLTDEHRHQTLEMSKRCITSISFMDDSVEEGEQ